MSSFTISYWNVLANGYPYSEDHGEPIFNGQTSVGLERIQKILKKLSDFMNEYPDIILCLQEVNNPIFKELLIFLNKKNYSYLYQNNDIYNDILNELEKSFGYDKNNFKKVTHDKK